MSSGLLALLDDIAALAKVAAATLDDAAAQATKAGAKAAGVVIDDAAVTPRYVVGFAAERELPIIGKIALGSLRNKILIILPAALVLSAFAPWLIPWLLLVGGLFLAWEGFHKVMDYINPHAHAGDDNVPQEGETPEQMENRLVAGAVRTDFILSAEIMAIALGALAGIALWMQAVGLFIVGLAMTALVYGAVALIVKADDVGYHMSKKGKLPLTRVVGRGIVKGMPPFLKALSFIGMIAMLWVGGQIVVHELYILGVKAPEQIIHHAAESVAHLVPPLEGAIKWLVNAAISAVVGLALGAAVEPLAKHVLGPLWQRLIPKKDEVKSATPH